jgi:hypothetical protein
MSTLTEILESLSGGSGVARRLDAGEMLFTTGDPVRVVSRKWWKIRKVA